MFSTEKVLQEKITAAEYLLDVEKMELKNTKDKLTEVMKSTSETHLEYARLRETNIQLVEEVTSLKQLTLSYELQMKDHEEILTKVSLVI